MKNLFAAGFVPLVDAAPLIVALEKGFAQQAGIKLRLSSQPSWASLRDHLNLGHLDCAHTLAPLPIATVLGIGQVRSQLIVPLVMSRGGNAITVSATLAKRMRELADGDIKGAAASAAALARVIADSDEILTLGMVYPYSGHNFEMRYWLASAGIHPDKDVRLVPIPPPLMVESLRAGQVDGFCVGEPWNSVAVHQGCGEIVATKSEIFPHGIEKVLALRAAAEADPAPLAALLQSLHAAAQWCDETGNHEELAAILSRREYLNLPPALVAQSLDGRMPGLHAGANEDFVYFARNGAGRPRKSDALWLYAQMRRWGQVPDTAGFEAAVQDIFRPDLFDAAIAADSAAGAIVACDGIEFTGGDVRDYLAQFSLSTPFTLAPDSGA